MTLSGSVTGAADGGNNLNPAYADKFADYLADVVQHFHDHWGVTFDSLDPINEFRRLLVEKGRASGGLPLRRQKRPGQRPERHHYQDGVGPQTARIRRPPSAASDENSIDRMVASFSAYDDAAKAAIAQINTHSYGGSKRAELRALAESHGKRLWMSEYGDGDASGLTMSRQIVSDMTQMRPTAWVYWQVSDGGGWGMIVHDNNLTGPNSYGYTLSQKYWVMANYSRFIRPGCQIIDIGDPNSLAAYEAKTGTLVIVTTNSAKADATLTYDLSRFRRLPKTAVSYRTSATESLAKMPVLALSGGTLPTVAKAGSVTTYILKAQP